MHDSNVVNACPLIKPKPHIYRPYALLKCYLGILKMRFIKLIEISASVPEL